MKDRTLRYLTIAVVLFFALLFVAKFAGQNILRLYIETGVGRCEEIPVLCMVPNQKIVNLSIDKEYIAKLLPYKLPKINIYLPKGFSVVQELIKKVYYKKMKHRDKGAVVYLLCQEPGFFVNLYPQVKKQGVENNYEFIKRTMFAQPNGIKNITDAFFVIMKSIFIPNLGNQNKAIMAEFTMADKRGFINYNLSKPDSYFDCKVINNKDDFFGIYIKDKGQTLDLNKVLAIISTVNKPE